MHHSHVPRASLAFWLGLVPASPPLAAMPMEGGGTVRCDFGRSIRELMDHLFMAYDGNLFHLVTVEHIYKNCLDFKMVSYERHFIKGVATHYGSISSFELEGSFSSLSFRNGGRESVPESEIVLPRMFVMPAFGIYRRERQDHRRLSISQFNDPL